MGRIEDMVQRALYYAANALYGYSQANRWPWQGTDMDCSSMMYICANEAGYDVPLNGYTGTMLADFSNAGFTVYDYGSVAPQRGDIMLAHNSWRQHTEMYIGNGQTVGAHSSETGGIYGQMGDQTGSEISVSPDYGNWDWILRPPADKKPEQIPGEPINDAGFEYQAHVENLGWCEAVRDGQVAGTVGFGLRLEAIKVRPPQGVSVRLKAHVENVGWQDYGVATHDKPVTVGTTGKAQRLEMLSCEVVENKTNKHLEFRAHAQDVGWLPWTPSGYATGSDGQHRRLEAVQMRMV